MQGAKMFIPALEKERRDVKGNTKIRPLAKAVCWGLGNARGQRTSPTGMLRS